VNPGDTATVSVVLPTYNRADRLAGALASALAQHHPVHEVLVCDDGSTDDSAAVVEQAGDPRVRWLPAAVNSGSPAEPRNRGVAAATGEWVAFLDSDDLWLPTHVASLLATATRAGAPIACGNAWLDHPGDPAVDRYHRRLPARLGRLGLLWDNRVITSTVLARTDLLRAVAPFPRGYGFGIYEDYSVWLRVSLHTVIPVCQEPTIVYHRDTPGAASGQVRTYPSLQATAAEHRRWCRSHGYPAAAPLTLLIGARAEAGRAVRTLRRVRSPGRTPAGRLAP